MSNENLAKLVVDMVDECYDHETNTPLPVRGKMKSAYLVACKILDIEPFKKRNRSPDPLELVDHMVPQSPEHFIG